MPEVVEVVGYPVQVVEIPAVVGQPGIVTPALIADITDDVLDALEPPVDLNVLVVNALT